MVQRSWVKHCYAPNSAAILCKKLKTLRYDLKQWSKKISKLSMLIENCNKTLLEIDGLEERRRLSLPKANFRGILKEHLLHLLECKKAYWRKRCTIRWIQFGDENSKFFQTIATEHYRRNCTSYLKNADGGSMEDPAGKESILFETFKARMG